MRGGAAPSHAALATPLTPFVCVCVCLPRVCTQIPAVPAPHCPGKGCTQQGRGGRGPRSQFKIRWGGQHLPGASKKLCEAPSPTLSPQPHPLSTPTPSHPKGTALSPLHTQAAFPTHLCHHTHPLSLPTHHLVSFPTFPSSPLMWSPRPPSPLLLLRFSRPLFLSPPPVPSLPWEGSSGTGQGELARGLPVQEAPDLPGPQTEPRNTA